MLAALLLLVAVGVGLWWLRWTGALHDTGDRLKESVAKLYPSQPSSGRVLPRKLLRSAERTVTIGVSGIALVPTRIEIRVNPDDLAPFAQATDWLSRDIAEALRKRAVAKGWTVPNGPHIVIIADPERPLRLPHATGYIGALSPEDIRTLAPTDAGSGLGAAPNPEAPNAEAPNASDPTYPPPDPGNAGPSQAGVANQANRAVPTEALAPTSPPDMAGVTDSTRATSAVPMLHFRLVSTDEPDADMSGILSSVQTALVLGRSRQADLRVKDQSVSGQHCAFRMNPQDGTLTVEDLESTNGTYVGGHRAQNATLSHGDSLTAGSLSWRVELETPRLETKPRL